jgi:hypothetical protein
LSDESAQAENRLEDNGYTSRRDGETQHKEAHHQAGLRRSDVERGTHGRQCWQAHVDAEGRQGDEKAQQQNESHGGRLNAHG